MTEGKKPHVPEFLKCLLPLYCCQDHYCVLNQYLGLLVCLRPVTLLWHELLFILRSFLQLLVNQ